MTPLYREWMRAALGRDLEDEPQATCSSCAMLPASESPELVPSFIPETKCCTHQPNVPSFLVGGVLGDPDPLMEEGKKRVRARIAARKGATPMGVHSPRESLLDLGEQFGRNAALLCDYAEGQELRCTIWKHRNAMCATWFCKHARGRVGYRMWTAVQQCLAAVQQALSIDCVLALHPAPRALALLFNENGQPFTAEGGVFGTAPDGTIAEEVYRQLWGEWLGREEEYFIRCANRIAPLSWDDVLAIGGARVALLLQNARNAAFAAFDERLPERLVRLPLGAELCWSEHADGTMFVSAVESGYQAVKLSRALFDDMAAFDGERIDVPLSRLRARHGGAPDDAKLRALVDWGILVEPENVPKLEAAFGPEDILAFSQRAPSRAFTKQDAEGKVMLVLALGSVEIAIDDPALFPFGNALATYARGFRASAACGWTAGEPMTWERAKELLEPLVRRGFLEVSSARA